MSVSAGLVVESVKLAPKLHPIRILRSLRGWMFHPLTKSRYGLSKTWIWYAPMRGSCLLSVPDCTKQDSEMEVLNICGYDPAVIWRVPGEGLADYFSRIARHTGKEIEVVLDHPSFNWPYLLGIAYPDIPFQFKREGLPWWSRYYFPRS